MHPNLAIIAQNRLGASPKNGISLEGIIIFLEKISAKTPNPELLRSIPEYPNVYFFGTFVKLNRQTLLNFLYRMLYRIDHYDSNESKQMSAFLLGYQLI
jgi:hypothetical protein